MKRTALLAAVLAATVAAACGDPARTDLPANDRTGAESSAVGTTGDPDAMRVPDGDRDFVREIAAASAAEIELGKMAVERAASADVKKFGQMMVDDHTQASEKLRAIASQHNIPMTEQLDDKHRELRDKLAALRGAEFDRQYIDAMVDGHESVLDKLGSRTDKAELENWKARQANPDTGRKQKLEVEAISVVPEKSDNVVTMSINQWAAESYPVVYAHLEAAKDAKAGVKSRATQ